MNRTDVLRLSDIQIFRFIETGRLFPAVAYGNSNRPAYILNVYTDEKVQQIDVEYVGTYWSVEEASHFATDKAIQLNRAPIYGSFYHRLSSVFDEADIDMSSHFIVEGDSPRDYSPQLDIVGRFCFCDVSASDGEALRLHINGRCSWSHIGYIVKANDQTAFECACEYVEDTNETIVAEKFTTTTQEEKATMQGALQKGGEIASNLIQVNKDSMSVVAQLTAGGTALQIAINRIEQFVPADKREQFKIYANTPLGKLAVANLLSVAQSQFMGASNKAKYIADGAVISAMNEVAQALPIQQIVIDLFSGINVPEIQG